MEAEIFEVVGGNGIQMTYKAKVYFVFSFGKGYQVKAVLIDLLLVYHQAMLLEVLLGKLDNFLFFARWTVYVHQVSK